MNPSKLKILAWSLSIASVLLAFLVWGQSAAWKLTQINAYQLFPLFGLLAFSLMWGHYVMVALRVHFKIDKSHLKTYFEITSLAVLAAILIHPGLLAWQLWRDGLGLPPASEFNYVGSSLKVSVIFGFVSLTVFLAYEFRRLYEKKSWWKYVQYASDGAILLIVMHALQLGSHLQLGWYLALWYFYALTLLIALTYIYLNKLEDTKPGS